MGRKEFNQTNKQNNFISAQFFYLTHAYTFKSNKQRKQFYLCSIFFYLTYAYTCCSLSVTQEITPESFVTDPIIFGDYIKMGAEKHDRLYEELSDLKKLKSVLQDVS